MPNYDTDAYKLSRFTRIRKELGITLVTLESAVHIPRSRLSNYENGVVHLPYHVAIRLARFFLINVDELFPEIAVNEASKVSKVWTDYVGDKFNG